MKSARLDMLDEELADTLEAARRKRGLPPTKAPVGELARDIVGDVKPPKVGACSYCGAPAPGLTVCDAHSDLSDLDPGTSPLVTQNSTGSGRTHLDGGRAAGASRR